MKILTVAFMLLLNYLDTLPNLYYCFDLTALTKYEDVMAENCILSIFWQMTHFNEQSKVYVWITVQLDFVCQYNIHV